MLKNFWYACEFSSAITNKPKQVSLLNQQFVLYRNSQREVVAYLDRCPHRGAALSNGWVENDCIRCPYHGWKFTTDGTCIEIPANQPGVPVPKKARLQTYPVQEKYGFVWLFWGDLPEKERPPLPSFPEVKNPAYRSVENEFKWNAHYTHLVENFIDTAHLPFVHANSFASKIAQKPQFSEYKVDIQDWGASTVNTTKKLSKSLFWKYIYNHKDDVETKTTYAFYMPNFGYLSINNGSLIFFSIQVPVDDNTTITKSIQFRNFLTYSWADGIFRKPSLKARLEDQPIVESQQPKVVPYDLTAELHTSSDYLSIAYRKLRQKCLDMDWGTELDIDPSHYTNGHIPEDSQTQLMDEISN